MKNLPIENPPVVSDSVALPNCAPQALICVDRVELNHHWLHRRIPTIAATLAWHALVRSLSCERAILS